MENHTALTPLAQALVTVFESQEITDQEQKITVNRFISEIASWYEKLRNAMDLRDEEVVLRSAIERILKRRLSFQGNGKKIAEPLIRELLWARYFPDASVSQSSIDSLASIIDTHLAFRQLLLQKHALPEKVIHEWVNQLMSAGIAKFLRPNKEKEAMGNFMFHLLQQNITITDDSEDTRNVQLFLAIRKSFARDDMAFLRFYMFQQIFGNLTPENLHEVAEKFPKGYQEIERQLTYPLKEKMYLYTKKLTPIFFILEDVLYNSKNGISSLISDTEAMHQAVFKACEERYKNIGAKVRTAIVRSVIFLLLTKVFIAYVVEGTYDKFLYGHIMWLSLGINIGIPPLLMIIVSLFIKTPGKDNSERILHKVRAVLFEPQPHLANRLILTLHPKKNTSILTVVFALLWLFAFVLSFGGIIYVLTKLQFNIISQIIFIFFLTIVSFLSWRINTTANMYKIGERQGLFTPFVDFLFLPIIRVGMRLTQEIAQINIFIFIFDFFIEAPFKVLFSFFEQWFVYLHTKREDLG